MNEYAMNAGQELSGYDPYDETEQQHEPMIRLITFDLADERYGVEVSQVREILRVNQVFPVPGAPDYVVGITNIRGSVVTIIDGRRRFNLPPAEYTDLARMVVLESEDEIAAVMVDSVSDVIDVPRSQVESNPKMNARDDSPYISGVVTDDKGLIILLKVETFITDDNAAAF